MNEFENKAEVQPGVEELRNEIQSLRALLSFSLLLVFIFSLCVNIFLMRQVSTVGSQAGQAASLVNTWSKNGSGQTTIMDFWTKLNDFSRTHPDFAPIINKYSSFFSTARPATAPAAAPAKKK